MGFNVEGYRKRLAILRRLYGESQTDFAKRLGVPFKKWNHYERGYPIPRETAFIINDHVPDIPIDWIWFGNERMMPLQTLKRIRQAEHDIASELDAKRREQAEALKQARSIARKRARRRNGADVRR